MCAVCAAVFFASSIAIVLVYRFAPVRLTPLMLIRKAEAFNRGERLELKQDWVAIEHVSPDMISAVIESEDAHFYEHGGFSYHDMLDAFYRNKRTGFIVAGGSTISQQTAKNVFCTPARTYARKALEAYFTMLIELLWGKQRILEVYLNVIEMGPGIYGAEAAAQQYYKCHANKLTRRQAVSIAICLPNPLKSNPTKLTPYQTSRCNRLLEQMQ